MRLPSLDGIRAISIALVVGAHASNGWGFLRYGGFGVNIFFVLSGFLITWLLCCEEKKNGRVSLSAFYQRRVFRILPPALVYLAAVAVIFGPDWRDILHSILFVRNITQGPIYTAHFWSLSIEEQFYLLWPSIFLLLGSNVRRLIFALLLLAFIPVWIQINIKMAGGASLLPLPRFDLRCEGILTGCCLALLRDNRRFERLMRGPVLQSGWMFAIAGGVLLVIVRGPMPACIEGVLSSLAVAAMINAAVGWKSGFLNYGPVVWLATLSYSVYIWQQLFCTLAPVGWLGRFPQNVLATLGAACLSYYLIERPALSLRNRLSERWKGAREPALRADKVVSDAAG